MASAENKKTGFDTPAVVLGGLAAIAFVIALSLFLMGGWNAARNREIAAKIYAADISEESRTLRAEQQGLLAEKVRYLDEEAGRLCMPIEDAMERVVAREQGR
ncbi:hypothetical protein KDM41_13195 [bacterium]|nr:hypothetical protein [bacterium]